MNLKLAKKFLQVLFAVLLAGLSLAARAQPTGLLYDPEPPADSAYVRILLASPGGAVDILVDGRPRIQKLRAGAASDYMVLTAGKHTIAVHPAGKPTAPLSTSLEVVRGRAMTVAFIALRSDMAPFVFEDKANSNKLKAVLAVYHLDAKAGPLDVLTADGKTKVFSGVSYGTSASIQVNPISADLIVTAAGENAVRGRASLSMTQGGTYSIILMSDASGSLVSKTVQNKIERYTGK